MNSKSGKSSMQPSKKMSKAGTMKASKKKGEMQTATEKLTSKKKAKLSPAKTKKGDNTTKKGASGSGKRKSQAAQQQRMLRARKDTADEDNELDIDQGSAEVSAENSN